MRRVYDEELVPKRDVVVDGYILKQGCIYTVDHRDEEGGCVLVQYSGWDRTVTVRDLRPFRLIRKPRWEFGSILGPVVRTAAVLYLAVAWSISPGKGKTP